jgi:endonuclease III
MTPTAHSNEHLLEVARRLKVRYGHDAKLPNVFNDELGVVAGPDSEPLHGLIGTILSQQSRVAVTVRMARAFRVAYPEWQLAIDAGQAGIQQTLEGARGTLARSKASYIHQTLTRLLEERDTCSLSFLRSWKLEDARQYLLSFPGVGPKTANWVLLFNLQHPAQPVDTHLHRLAQRLTYVSAASKAVDAGIWLERHLPATWQAHYEFHLNALVHGQTTCRAVNPKCAVCVLADLCPSSLINDDQSGSVSV